MVPSAELLPGNLDLVTAFGRRQFAQDQSSWQRLVDAIAQSLTVTPQEI